MPTSLDRHLVYPWAFALAPVASLLVQNIDAVPPKGAIRAALLLLALTALGLLVGRPLFRSARKAAIFWTLTTLTSFLFGHLARQVSTSRLPLESATGYQIALAVWMLMMALMAVIVAKSRAIPSSLFAGLDAAGIVALGIPAILLVFVEVRMASRWAAVRPEIPPVPSAQALSDLPDIYYIILDGYGRQDVLSSLFGLDQDDFYEALRVRGFSVADRSYGNYAQTSLSLASALNLSYLHNLRSDYPQDRSQLIVGGMIRHSLLGEILHRHGYSTVAYSVGYRRAEMSTADSFVEAPRRHTTPFEAMLIEVNSLMGVTSLPVLFGRDPWLPGYESQRESIEFIYTDASGLPGRTEPTFALIHILAPHPPFVFDANGGLPPQRYPYRLRDGSEFLGTQEEYIRGYREQVRYVNGATLDLIDSLQAASQTPPVIILQGDHGPGSQLDWEDPYNTNMWERMAILNAYSVPGLPPDSIGPSISPVNTFRLVMNHLLGYSFERLPDQSYFSSWIDPYNFLLVHFSADNSWEVERQHP